KGLLAMTAFAKAHQSSGKSKSALLNEAIHAAFLPQVQKQVEEIYVLGLPEGEEGGGQVNAFLEAMEEGIKAASKAAQNGQSSFKHSAELAHELGIDACAYGG